MKNLYDKKETGQIGPISFHFWAVDGTEILKQGFHIAKEHGMDKVLMNINDENLVSAHICEKLGGKLMDRIQSYNDAEGHHIMRRYWIYL